VSLKDSTDEELFDALREQVNLSRNGPGHDRVKTRAVAAEMKRRGWKTRVPTEDPQSAWVTR
jgi:phage gp16-like protein